MENQKLEKTVKLPTFDGKRSSFQIWWTRFLAYATVFMFRQALVIGGESKLPQTEDEVLDLTEEDDRKKELARKRNAVAMANLTMAFTGEETMGLIYDAQSQEWPAGLAHKVVKALMSKYQPEDTITRVELRQMLNGVTMKKDEDPATIFEQISAIKNRYNTSTKKIDPEELIAVVLDVAPKEYKAVLTSEQRRKGTNLVIEDLSSVMNQLWRQMYGKNNNNSNDNGGAELTLAAFEGHCYKCNEKGHKANKCPNGNKNNTNKGRRFNGNCNLCGKKGHKAIDCWEKPENAHKRPKNYHPKGNEQASAAINEGRVEYLLAGMSFPKSISILNDPNVWIADSAATVHSSPHAIGMTNLREPAREDNITMGNGDNEQASKIANLFVTVCDNEGNEKTKAKIEDVTLAPTTKFNLFSCSRMMKKGWLLGGDDKTMWLSKGKQRIEFDIVIPTPKGCIYCVYLRRDTEIAGAAPDSKVKISIKEAHEWLNHANEDDCRKTAKALGWELKAGSLGKCTACTIGKAKQANISKDSDHEPAKEPNERVNLDISTFVSTPGIRAVGVPH